MQTPLQQQFRVCLPHQPCRDRTQNNSHHSCTYCILNRAFCLDDFTSSLIALTTLSRSSFKLCLTRANICSIVSFIESALANIISLLNVYLLSYFYFFINISIRMALLRVKATQSFHSSCEFVLRFRIICNFTVFSPKESDRNEITYLVGYYNEGSEIKFYFLRSEFFPHTRLRYRQ